MIKKKFIRLLLVGLTIQLFVLTSSKTFAEIVTVESTPNADFSITYDDVQFGLPLQMIPYNNTITYKDYIVKYIVSTALQKSLSETNSGWDKMNYDGSIVQNDFLPSFDAVSNASGSSVFGISNAPGVYKAYYASRNNFGDSAVFPVTYYIFHDISLDSKPLTVLQGDNLNITDVEISGSDGTGNAITSYSEGLSLHGKVDTYIPGSYPVTHTFNDPANVHGIKSTDNEIIVLPKPIVTPPVIQDTTVGENVNLSGATVYDPAHLGEGVVSTIQIENLNGDSLILNDDLTFTPTVSGTYTATYTYEFVRPDEKIGTVSSSSTFNVEKELDIVAGSVSVYYQDKQGNEIANPVILNGNIDESYEAKEMKIDGYTLKRVEGNRTGFYSDSDQVVKFIYMKNEKVDETSEPKSNNEDSKTISLSAVSTSPLPEKSAVLPQTGEKNSPILSVIGSMTLLAGGAYILNLNRKKSN